MDFQTALEILSKADEAGAGGQQRDLVLSAISHLAVEYRVSMTDAGNDTYIATSILKDSILS